MEKRGFDKLGVFPSLLGFGSMRLPTHRMDGTIDFEQAEKLFDIAYENGINYFDTAWGYHNGIAEILCGEALRRYRRDTIFIADKLPLWAVKTKKDAKDVLDTQLKKVRAGYFDFYLLHAMEEQRWEKALELDIMSLLEDEKKKGNIRAIGFSFHDTPEVFKRMLTDYPKWDFAQLQLNYIDTYDGIRSMECYDLLKERGIPCTVMEPVRGGALAHLPEDLEQRLKKSSPDRSVASWALRWCAARENVKVILSGMSSIEQLTDNIATFSDYKPLTADETKLIEDIASEIKSRPQISCTACNYCRPCPAGVDISGCFAMYNHVMRFGNAKEYKERYNALPEKSKADSCVKCGMCREKCPQKLDIPNELVKVKELFGQK